MIDKLREGFGRLFGPLAKLLLKWGISPDAVTIGGTLGVVGAALWLFPTGHLFWGTMIVWFFAMSDAIDGLMARKAGRSSVWGSFLDSTLDRVADAAIFTGIGIYLLRAGELWGAGAALTCLILGAIVPYARAKAESLNMTAAVGIAERGDRLVTALIATGLVGLGLNVNVLTVVLLVLALASLITVIQRMAVVYAQAKSLTLATGTVPNAQSGVPESQDETAEGGNE